ncbi:MAG: hypothetical protein JOZ16_00750 [Methylobacteriaceae bacterium]|nr:hypothetical protein [Methylobacteriaceae bacterium]
MLDAVVKSLGLVLEPDDIARVRDAYAISIEYVAAHEPEFCHWQPRRLRTKLAHHLIKLAAEGGRDCQALSDQAILALRVPNSPRHARLAR